MGHLRKINEIDKMHAKLYRLITLYLKYKEGRTDGRYNDMVNEYIRDLKNTDLAVISGRYKRDEVLLLMDNAEAMLDLLSGSGALKEA